ncbi:MAG TPA: sodium:proton antiporter [Lachnospiraceae bacterium]|nr:sodium:proton antiporter [Lachnospiraceae bacterium]
MNGDFELFYAVFFPFAAAFLCYLSGRVHKMLRDRLLQLFVILEMALMAFAAFSCFQKGMLEFAWNGFCMQGLYLKMDGFRLLYGCIAAFMWMMTGIFSREYFAHYRNRNRYYFFYLLTLGATVGVFLSGDFYTTFIFFEIMSLTSYVWVVHDEKPAAMKAGEIYLAIAIVGGLVMLMGLFLLQDAAGTLRMSELHDAVLSVPADRQWQIYAAGGCMLFGFGAKAGMFPLHVWLPKAHPVAPAPASALLSGILTKTGVFGVLVVSAEMFRYDPQWGKVVLYLGVITMFGGALLAVFSIDLKRTLACSSMSQIGFILVGAGMMELLGQENALAVRGTILHMVNHSMIKLVLFMAAGVIYMNLHKLNLNDIRGFGKNKPLLKGMFLMGALSIGGIPGWSGYVSKTLLHESIVEYAAELVAHGEPALRIHIIEWIFLITGGMTIAYMIKLFIAVFIEEHPDRQKEFDGKKGYMNPESIFAILVPTVILVCMGFFPYLTMNRAADLAQGFLHGEAPAHAVHYFSLGNLKGALISLAIGALVYFGFIRKFLVGKDEKERQVYLDVWPTWLDLEDLLYRPTLHKAAIMSAACICRDIDQLYLTRKVLRALLETAAFLGRICDHLMDGILLFFRSTTHKSRTEKHVYLIGTRASRTLGRILDNFTALLNRTVCRKKPIEHSFVLMFAEWEDVMHKTNRLISVSLSFGLMLAAVGLAMTLVYLLWW